MLGFVSLSTEEEITLPTSAATSSLSANIMPTSHNGVLS